MRVHERQRWHPGRAFALGGLLGALGGAVWSWIDYGGFEIAYMSNHVLGGIFICAIVFAAAAALMNWRARNPH